VVAAAVLPNALRHPDGAPAHTTQRAQVPLDELLDDLEGLGLGSGEEEEGAEEEDAEMDD
jgi:hypothetical protein